MRICFDMDGTLADLYGVNNWLAYLTAEDVKPYAEASTLVRMAVLAKALNKAQRRGHKICVVSWLSKTGSPAYNKAVAEVKRAWLAKHLPSVSWDEINIVKYGTPKSLFCDSAHDILFDDELQNRQAWAGKAYTPDAILTVLKNI